MISSNQTYSFFIFLYFSNSCSRIPSLAHSFRCFLKWPANWCLFSKLSSVHPSTKHFTFLFGSVFVLKSINILPLTVSINPLKNLSFFPTSLKPLLNQGGNSEKSFFALLGKFTLHCGLPLKKINYIEGVCLNRYISSVLRMGLKNGLFLKVILVIGICEKINSYGFE